MPKGYKHFSKTKPMKREHFNCVDEWWNDRKEIVDEKEHEDMTTTYKGKNIPSRKLHQMDIILISADIQPKKNHSSPEDTLLYIFRKENI